MSAPRVNPSRPDPAVYYQQGLGPGGTSILPPNADKEDVDLMLRFSRMKTISVVLLTVLGILYAMPSLLAPETRASIQRTFSFLPSWIVPHQAIVLGLDLQGGSHVLLEVDTQAVLRAQINTLRDDVRRVLREQRVSLQGGINVTPRGVSVRVADAAERERLDCQASGAFGTCRHRRARRGRGPEGDRDR